MTSPEPPTGKPCVWVTRSMPGANATAEQLKEMGFDPIVGPLLAVRPVPDSRIDLTGVGGLVFTSSNAVITFSSRRPERGLPVFTVGDATAETARNLGFTSVMSAQGDAKALAAFLTQRRDEIDGDLFYGSAAEPAVDLAGMVAGAGITVRQAPLYETVPAPLSEEVVQRLPQVNAVLLYSARAAALLADALAAHPAPRLAAYCLSYQVAEALRGALTAVAVAKYPTDSELLSLLASGFKRTAATRT
jgi:uroporphyrinogen-III synthase